MQSSNYNSQVEGSHSNQHLLSHDKNKRASMDDIRGQPASSSHRTSSSELRPGMFPAIRNQSRMTDQERSKLERNIKYLQYHLDLQQISKFTDEVANRRQVLNNLIIAENMDELDISYHDLMTMDIV